ncbi:MAG TPA: SRPBCC family protein, partial [bacterium]
NAFKRVEEGRALLQTPAGACEIGLRVDAARAQGTIDWIMTFPDGAVDRACSRLTDLGNGTCAYTFTLLPPKVQLEQLEGTLDLQAKTLAQELAHLQRVLER